MDICDIHFAAKGHIYARLFHGHSILFIRYAALLRYCSPMRLSCLFLERRVSLSLDTVSFYDSDGSYVLLRDGPYYKLDYSLARQETVICATHVFLLTPCNSLRFFNQIKIRKLDPLLKKPVPRFFK